jgi:hypothetical protein
MLAGISKLYLLAGRVTSPNPDNIPLDATGASQVASLHWGDPALSTPKYL